MEPARSRGMVSMHPRPPVRLRQQLVGFLFCPIRSALRKFGECCGVFAISIISLAVCGNPPYDYRCRTLKAGGLKGFGHPSALRLLVGVSAIEALLGHRHKLRDFIDDCLVWAADCQRPTLERPWADREVMMAHDRRCRCLVGKSRQWLIGTPAICPVHRQNSIVRRNRVSAWNVRNFPSCAASVRLHCSRVSLARWGEDFRLP